MVAYMIARILNNSNLVGVRILGESGDSYEIKDASLQQVIEVIRSKKLDITNLEIKHNCLHGYGASLERYPSIDVQGRPLGKTAAVTILNQVIVDDTLMGYTVSDYKGKVARWKLADTIKYGSLYGLTNAKLVTKGTTTIVPIAGTLNEYRIETGEKVQAPRKEDSHHKEGNPKKEGNFKKLGLSEFIDYMKSNGYDYKLDMIFSKLTLVKIDNRITELVIPDGVVRVGHFQEETTSMCKKIYIPNSVETILDYIFKNMPYLEEVVFEDSRESLMLDKLGLNTYENRRIKFNLPKHMYKLWEYTPKEHIVDFNGYTELRTISNCLYGSVLPEMEDRSDDEYIKYISDMPMIAYEIEKINLGNITEMYSSIRDLRIKRLKIPRTMHRMLNSVVRCLCLEEIDFSEAENLISIENGSLKNLDSIKKIDMSKCKSLSQLGTSTLSFLKNLEEVILPDSYTNGLKGVFNVCPKLKRVVMSPNISNISLSFKDTALKELVIGTFTNVSFELNQNIALKIVGNEQIQSGRIQGKFAGITMSDSITVLSDSCLRGVDSDIRLPINLEEIKELALAEYTNSDKILDLSYLTKLRTLGDYAFERSELRILILPDGVETLGKGAFKSLLSLEKIYIPLSVKKIGQSILYGSIEVNTVVYTGKGSAVEKYCKNSNIPVIYADSAEEARELILSGEEIVEDKQLAKLRMLIGHLSRHNELFTEPYIDKATVLYKIFTKLSTDIGDTGIALNTNNLVSVNIEDLLKARELDTLSSSAIEEDRECLFNAMCNCITAVYTNNSNLLTKENFEYINSLTSYIKVEYKNTHGMVISLYFVDECKYRLLIVIKGDKAIYCSAFGQSSENDLTFRRQMLNRIVCDHIDYELADKKIGNTSVSLPLYINNKFKTALKSQFITLYNVQLKGPLLSQNRRRMEMYLYDLMSGNILECDAVIYMKEMNLTVIEAMHDIKVRNIESLDTLSNKTKLKLNSIFNPSEIVYEIGSITSKGKLTDKLSKMDGAYDEYEPCYEWELSKAIQNMNSVKDFNYRQLLALLKTSYMYPTRKSISLLQKGTEPVYFKQSYDGRYTVIQKKLDEDSIRTSDKIYKCGTQKVYGTFIIDSTKSSDTVQCYISTIELDKVFNLIKDIYRESNIVSLEVNDELIETDKYFIVESLYQRSFLNINIAVAIARETGIVYIVATHDNYNKALKIMRLRSLEDGLPLLHREQRETMGVFSLESGENVNYLVNKFEVRVADEANQSKFTTSLINKLRARIMSGGTNYDKVNKKYEYAYKLAAKQPK